MKQSFSKLSNREKEWLDTYLDGTIKPADFERMQDHMIQDAAFRKSARQYLSLDHALSSLGENGHELSLPWQDNPPPADITRFPPLLHLAAAAALAFLLGSGLMFWFAKSSPAETPTTISTGSPTPLGNGFAVIKNLFNPTWDDKSHIRFSGDTLSNETFHLGSGTAEIQFYSGAFMTIEGPAELSLKSAWEAVCHEGAIRMKVPPAARGFKLQSPATEIIDLGTEFGLVVKNGESKVEVLEGEIALNSLQTKDQRLFKGDALSLTPNGTTKPLAPGIINIPSTEEFHPGAAEQQLRSFQNWQKYRDELARDPDLIAYYGFNQNIETGHIPNLALPSSPELDGTVILSEPVSGRWQGLKSAFEFRRPGSRIRVNIPGEFLSLTLACWVRVDSLDRVYNALFMADGYENGEPHWQLRDDGKLMLSVMVDETSRHPIHPRKSRYHHTYFSPKIWDLSMSGQWIHLASVFNSSESVVTHFMNGEEISQEKIQAGFEVPNLYIGNAEIGNWGQPFREDPSFALRNLNGRMDELAIFKSALTSQEINQLYLKSRSSSR